MLIAYMKTEEIDGIYQQYVTIRIKNLIKISLPIQIVSQLIEILVQITESQIKKCRRLNR